MSDIKIFLMCVAWLALASLIITYAVESTDFSYLHDIKYSNINKTLDLINTTPESVNIKNIQGTWILNDGYIYPTSFDFFDKYAILEFGNKFSVNDMISEKISVIGVNYNASDTFGVSILRGNTYGNEIFLEFYGVAYNGIASRLRLVEQCPMHGTIYKNTEFTIMPNNHTVNVSYIYFRLNKTLIVSCENYVMWHGTIDLYNDLTINVAGGISYYNESLYTDFNKTEKSRVGTNIPTFKISGYTQNSISSYSYDTIQYTVTSNPLDFLNTLFRVLTFSSPPDKNGNPIIPYEFQFLLIGLPYLAIAGWIITAIIRGS